LTHAVSRGYLVDDPRMTLRRMGETFILLRLCHSSEPTLLRFLVEKL